MKEVVLTVGAIMLLVFVGLLLDTNGDQNAVDAPVEKVGRLEYQHVEIEGMPCLTVRSDTYYGHVVTSISCDWSKWKETP